MIQSDATLLLKYPGFTYYIKLNTVFLHGGESENVNIESFRKKVTSESKRTCFFKFSARESLWTPWLRTGKDLVI